MRSPASIVALAVLATTACASKREPASRALDAKDEPAWRARLARERAEKDHEFQTSPVSVLAAVERFAPTHAAFLRIDHDALVMDEAQGPATLIAFEPIDPAGTRWTWRPVSAAVATASAGAPPTGPMEITQTIRLELSSRFAIQAYVLGGGLVVTGFDRQRKELVDFHPLAYFEPAPRLFVAAKLERFAQPTRIELATSRGLKKPYLRVGHLKFELDGTRYTLTAFRQAGSTGTELFVPFRDATSGKESYGAARFLDLEEPADRNARVMLDFNEAYNPYCAYSNAYNCPMPPPENQLTVAITAGERAYAAGHY